MKIGMLPIQIILLVLWFTVLPTMPVWVVFLPLIILAVVLVVILLSAASVVISGSRPR